MASEIAATTNGSALPLRDAKPASSSLQPSTLALHADDNLPGPVDVAPPIHVSTIFHYDKDPNNLHPDTIADHDPHNHVYSRHSTPTLTRLEIVLSSVLNAPAVTYSSGLSAIFAIYTLLKPGKVSIGNGYQGTTGVLGLHTRLSGTKILDLDCAAEELGQGDVIHLETPLNPTGEALDIKHYADKAHSRGAYLVVDATFGPPGLQDPFRQGADVVMHSGTKYIGGHSDMLCGVLATKNEEWVTGLMGDRVFLGSVMGSLEGWLGVRSLRTMAIRVQRQAESATKIVAWLDAALKGGEDGETVGKAVAKVTHASLQTGDMGWLKEQMFGGFGPVFALEMQSEEVAKRLPSCLELFSHATSLGGVESTIEWRVMSGQKVSPTLMRVSIGIEAWEDLKGDFLRAFAKLTK
jgi:cystathionine beta-lyase/cystathionine gamma-synthase